MLGVIRSLQVNVYGSGTFTGTSFGHKYRLRELICVVGKGYNDTVTLGGLLIHNQFIGAADPVTIMPDGLDGILGYVSTNFDPALVSLPSALQHGPDRPQCR